MLNFSNFIPFSTHVDTHVVKTREGDYLITWLLSGFPFVGREDWELEHRHKTFNNLLQSLRAPDFENVAFWAHDVRRRRPLKAGARFRQRFNQIAGQREAGLRLTLARAGVDTLELSTDDDLAEAVVRFIDLRKRRLRAGKHAQAGRSMPSQMPARDRGSFGIPREGTRP